MSGILGVCPPFLNSLWPLGLRVAGKEEPTGPLQTMFPNRSVCSAVPRQWCWLPQGFHTTCRPHTTPDVHWDGLGSPTFKEEELGLREVKACAQAMLKNGGVKT